MIDKSLYYQRRYFCMALFATLLAFFVIVLGAYTRLSDAGLGCPDWPGCYGHFTVPKENTLHLQQSTFDVKKAWIEMTHRYVAGLLGMVIFALGLIAIRNRRISGQPLILPMVLVIMLVFQALLGMWTVTLKLLPLVVMAHLMGGFTTLSLLWWLTLKLNPKPLILFPALETMKSLRMLAIIGLIVLIFQLILGGWTSANYAALACLDFPSCQTELLPTLDFKQAFHVMEPLNHTAKKTIHVLHRIGALITTLVIGWLAFLIFFRAKCIGIRILSIMIAVLLTLQILLGITNVLTLLPMPIALAHNAVAALLLLTLITVNYYLYAKPRRYQ